MTRYAVAGFSFSVGRRSAEMDRLLVRHGVRAAAFVSAFNPYSRRMPTGWNERMQARLRQASRRFVVHAGEGAWRGWREDHLLILGQPKPAIHLARRFRQNAVLVVRLRQPVGLYQIQ
jgi:Protein of unknown function (DUF3293)